MPGGEFKRSPRRAPIGATRWSGAATLCLMLVLLSPVQAESQASSTDEAGRHLTRMIEALNTVSYSGTFVYLHGNQLETLQITHLVDGDQVVERLVSLNGAAREVRLDPQALTCVMPEVKAVSESRRGAPPGTWPPISPDFGRLEGHYLLHPLGDFRVAGRTADVVGIIPKDRFRYGYRLYLDRETGLPLKTDLMGDQAKPLVQVMFTSLQLLPDGVMPEDAPLASKNYRMKKREAPRPAGSGQATSWKVEQMPPGFETQVHNHWTDDDGHPVEHLVLSDGLASVSVYLEKNASEEGLAGGAHLGAVNAWGGVVGDHRVTAVGEVPADTVRQIVESMRIESP